MFKDNHHFVLGRLSKGHQEGIEAGCTWSALGNCEARGQRLDNGLRLLDEAVASIFAAADGAGHRRGQDLVSDLFHCKAQKLMRRLSLHHRIGEHRDLHEMKNVQPTCLQNDSNIQSVIA